MVIEHSASDIAGSLGSMLLTDTWGENSLRLDYDNSAAATPEDTTIIGGLSGTTIAIFFLIYISVASVFFQSDYIL